MPRGRPKGSKNKLKPDVIRSQVVIFGKTFTAKGKTVEEAIRNLRPDFARGPSVLTLERGGVKKDRLLNRMLTTRLFGPTSDLTKEIAIHQVSQLFGL